MRTLAALDAPPATVVETRLGWLVVTTRGDVIGAFYRPEWNLDAVCLLVATLFDYCTTVEPWCVGG